MTLGDWAAVIVGIAGVLIAAASLPRSLHRGKILIASGTLIVITLFIGAISFIGRSGASPGHQVDSESVPATNSLIPDNNTASSAPSGASKPAVPLVPLQALQRSLITKLDIEDALGRSLPSVDGGGTLFSGDPADNDCYRGIDLVDPVNYVRAVYEEGPFNIERVGNSIEQYRNTEDAERAMQNAREAALKCGYREGDTTPFEFVNSTFRFHRAGNLEKGLAIDSGEPPYDITISRKAHLISYTIVNTQSNTQQAGAETLSTITIKRLVENGAS